MQDYDSADSEKWIEGHRWNFMFAIGQSSIYTSIFFNFRIHEFDKEEDSKGKSIWILFP